MSPSAFFVATLSVVTWATFGATEDNFTTELPTFEGDLLGIDSDAAELASLGYLDNLQKNGIIGDEYRWPNRTVPYEMGPTYAILRPLEHAMILDAMKRFEAATCLRFVPRTVENDYIKFFGGQQGCSSYVGRQSHMQPVVLNIAECFAENSQATIGIVQHELMHAVGFYHEQARSDRDNYVEINWPNIAELDRKQFLKWSNSTAFGEPYDFESVMHYGMYAFAIDDHVWTIRPRWPYRSHVIGQRVQLSLTDIRKINKMYRCEEDLSTTTATASTSAPSTSVSTLTDAPDLTEPVFEKPHRGCYYAYKEASSAGFGAGDIKPNLCTYIIVASAVIQGDRIVMPDEACKTTFGMLKDYRILYPTLKIFVSVGRQDGQALNTVMRNSASRTNFANSAASLLRDWDLDGLDVMLEQKDLRDETAESDDVTDTFKVLRDVFRADAMYFLKPRLAVSVAVFSDAASQTVVDGTALNSLVDIVNVVAYDLGTTSIDRTVIGHHAPTQLNPIGVPQIYNMESLMRQWNSSGFNRSKLVAGIPLYGRGWMLQQPDKHELGAPALRPVSGEPPGVWPFHELCYRIRAEGGTPMFHTDIKASYAYNGEWWTGYNDVLTIQIKISWLRRNAFGGVFVWELSQDDFANRCGDGVNPLMNAILNAFA